MRQINSEANHPSTDAFDDEDDAFRTAYKTWKEDTECSKSTGDYEVIVRLCTSGKRIWLQQEYRTQRPVLQPPARPRRRRPLPFLHQLAYPRDPPAGCIHASACLLSLSRPSTCSTLRKRPTPATISRDRPAASGACRLRMPGLRCTGILQQGALDGRLRGSPGSLRYAQADQRG